MSHDIAQQILQQAVTRSRQEDVKSEGVPMQPRSRLHPQVSTPELEAIVNGIDVPEQDVEPFSKEDEFAEIDVFNLMSHISSADPNNTPYMDYLGKKISRFARDHDLIEFAPEITEGMTGKEKQVAYAESFNNILRMIGRRSVQTQEEPFSGQF